MPMRYEYWRPAADLARYVGAYYIMEVPEGGGDIMRAQLPFLRFILSGTSQLEHDGETVSHSAPKALVCGPSFRTGRAMVSPGSSILAVMIKPEGWQALLGVPMRELSNRIALLDDFHPVDMASLRDRLAGAADDAEMFGVIDCLLRGMISATRAHNFTFLQEASAWLGQARNESIDTLLRQSGLSHRQVDRLCAAYFGAPPKRLQRTYRALHAATQLAWTDETDWRQVVGEGYYDQSHFIKDFKAMIGCTPGEYVRGPNMMIRFDLQKRLAIKHDSFFSIIA
ncbi:MAG: helix-turn-helix domain-containing protein [Salaquimonas sp.]|nr:helix-turn-helix domain-containing protein [Salaquimonas sp.]